MMSLDNIKYCISFSIYIKFVSPLPFLPLVNYNSIKKENEKNNNENNKKLHTTLQSDNNKCTVIT